MAQKTSTYTFLYWGAFVQEAFAQVAFVRGAFALVVFVLFPF
jgi:hypothetical protein